MYYLKILQAELRDINEDSFKGKREMALGTLERERGDEMRRYMRMRETGKKMGGAETQNKEG